MFETIKNKLLANFPKFQIKFKDQSWFMKLLGKLLFFNKRFMTDFTTTINNTIYFPSENFVKVRSISSFTIIMHELVHIYDANKYSFPIFSFLYLFPQSLILLSLFLFIFSWKIALASIILFLLPLPAYFRMHFEKRAYLVSLYVMHKLNIKYNYEINLNNQKDYFLKSFKTSAYYFMWPFSDLDKVFSEGLAKIENNERPYEDKVLFNKLDNILESY